MIDFPSLTTMLLNGVYRLLFTTIQYYSSKQLHALFFVTLASFASFLLLKLQFLALVSDIINFFLPYSLLATLLPFLCSELLEVNHIKTIYNIFVALLILLIFNTVVYDYIDTGRLVSVK